MGKEKKSYRTASPLLRAIEREIKRYDPRGEHKLEFPEGRKGQNIQRLYQSLCKWTPATGFDVRHCKKILYWAKKHGYTGNSVDAIRTTYMPTLKKHRLVFRWHRGKGKRNGKGQGALNLTVTRTNAAAAIGFALETKSFQCASVLFSFFTGVSYESAEKIMKKVWRTPGATRKAQYLCELRALSSSGRRGEGYEDHIGRCTPRARTHSSRAPPLEGEKWLIFENFPKFWGWLREIWDPRRGGRLSVEEAHAVFRAVPGWWIRTRKDLVAGIIDEVRRMKKTGMPPFFRMTRDQFKYDRSCYRLILPVREILARAQRLLLKTGKGRLMPDAVNSRIAFYPSTDDPPLYFPSGLLTVEGALHLCLSLIRSGHDTKREEVAA